MNQKNNKPKLPLIFLALGLFFFSSYPSVLAVCGDKIKDAGEECDFDPEIGPYPNQCPNNGPCDWGSCTCEKCVPSCACATSLCSNATCSDGCGGTCTGKKTCTDGKCGSANGKVATTIPTTNLCASGTASTVTGSNPWSWTCQGKDGGKDVSCGTGTSGDTSKYVSAYQYPNRFPYCSKEKNSYCSNENYAPCYDDGGKNLYHDPYSAIAQIKGYKNIYKLADPRILCQNESGCPDGIRLNPLASPNADGISGGGLQVKDYKNYTCDIYKTDPDFVPFNMYVNVLGPRFKYYFPPGTIRASLALQGTQGYPMGIGIVSRLGQPPSTKISDEFLHNFSWTRDVENHRDIFPADQYPSGCIRGLAGPSKEQLLERDWISTYEGYVYPIKDGYCGMTDLTTLNPLKKGYWLYTDVFHFYHEGNLDQNTLSTHQLTFYVDYKIFTTWYTCMTEKNGWDSNGDPREGFTACDPSAIPTGPGCDKKTCIGNSCYVDDTIKWIPGTRTQDCATGTTKATPDSLTEPGSSFITWSSQNASSVDVACEGVVALDRGTWYRSGEECFTAGKYCEINNNQKGYTLNLGENYFNQQKKTEVCTFYPTNQSDGQPGTPFSFKLNLGDFPVCGNNIVEDQEECDYKPSTGQISYVPCPDNKTCEKCKCVIPTKTIYVCEPKNSTCINYTCKDVSCFDGCNYQQGKMDCVGRR